MDLKDFTLSFAEQFEDEDREKIDSTTIFKNLDGWDSLTTMLVIAMIKTECGKDITALEIRSCDSVQDLFNFIYN